MCELKFTDSFRKYCICLKEKKEFNSDRAKTFISENKRNENLLKLSFISLLISVFITYFLFRFGFKTSDFILTNTFLGLANFIIIMINGILVVSICNIILSLNEINVVIVENGFKNYKDLKIKNNEYQNNKEYINKFETSICSSEYLIKLYNSKNSLTSCEIKILISLIDKNKKFLDEIDKKMNVEVKNNSMLILNN